MNLIPLFPALLLAGGVSPDSLTCTVTPRTIEAGAFYNGASVRVEGRAEASSKLVLTVTGPDGEERFSRKARFGPIWLNASKLRISGAPSLFLRFSTGPVAAILGESEIARIHLDEKSLMAHMHVEPQPSDYRDDAAIRNSYVALRTGEGRYSLSDGGVVLRGSARWASYTLNLRWPNCAPPATYEVRVYEVVQGVVVREASASLSVVRTGFAAWLAGMAANHASLYGILAVLISALAGLGVDRLSTLLFGKKHSATH
ncbi:MAG: TIGR02186 family protein [Bryobacteraceae bacterium]